MDERRVRETMNQIHISERMQEEIIMNIRNQMENRKKRARNRKRIATAAAAFVLTAGIVSIPVQAGVKNVVKARMESISKEELQGAEDAIQEQTAEVDGFSREYSEKETERSKELWQSYENGTFPESKILQVDNAEAVTEGTLCYVKSTGDFYLPEREMTDEELLEIIDFQHMLRYAIEQSPAAQEARAEYQAEKDRLKERVQTAGGISEEEAVEIARKQMESELGEEADGKELMTDVNGCGAFLVDISDDTSYEHEGDLAYDVSFGSSDDHSVYTCIIDAVDGRILHVNK